jgi:hypothetical protein
VSIRCSPRFIPWLDYFRRFSQELYKEEMALVELVIAIYAPKVVAKGKTGLDSSLSSAVDLSWEFDLHAVA